MKKLVTLFSALLILSTIPSFGQVIGKLDSYNGFKQFKFGKPASSFKNLELVKSTMNLKNVTSYNYTGKDITDFSGIKIADIRLDFFNNKLYKVSVGFSDFDQNDYSIGEFNVVKMALTSNFGEPNECQFTDPSMLNCAIWDGNNVRLDNIRMSTIGKPASFASGYMLFIDKTLESQQQASELN